MLKKYSIALLLIFSFSQSVFSQNLKKDFEEMTDSLFVLLTERTTVSTDELELEIVTRKGNNLDFRFSQELSDFPWNESNLKWFKSSLKSLLPEKYSKYSIGNVYAKTVNVNTLVTPELSSDGSFSNYKYRYQDHRQKEIPLVRRVGAPVYQKGLSGRHIALWQSHGRYYETSEMRWEWQRAQMHRTVEDMYTQSYVLPYLIPMLENSGAYVMTPRERDTQIHEVIIDNDPAFVGERNGLTRREGTYSERGNWSDAGVGFADRKEVYVLNDNPFAMGTARKVETVTEEKGNKCEAKWSFMVPQDGEYAVYVSYSSFENSTTDAHYSVRHAGGLSEFLVNQKMGGGTWIYLGTFSFNKDEQSSLTLDNISDHSGRIVSADAVKIGGGMGKIARGEEDVPVDEWLTSGMPSYMEGALYWEQFAGIDSTVTRNWEGDYTQDFASRGAWVSHLAGGSRVNPKEKNGKRIPFDLSFGFHTDAGIMQGDSIVGTLSIYTLKADGKSTLPDSRSRQLGRHFAGTVQDQVVNDIREDFAPEWNRRQLWNKNYSESRTTSVPGMLLELLSHQNLADMKYGLDPSFRFTVSRAVYKGMLKFLSDEYGIPYEVQPLPVNSMSACFISENEVKLSWKATEDAHEITAIPERFLLSTRIDDGVFSDPILLSEDVSPSAYSVLREGDSFSTIVEISEDQIYSFRVYAENDGGRSFPSEVMSVCRVPNDKGTVLIVNNFDRVSAPSWFDAGDYAGFNASLEPGMPYVQDISYIGENYEYRRTMEWVDDDNPGFGASFSDHAGEIVPGNTFDFIVAHGNAFKRSSYSFCSASRDAFTSEGFIVPESCVIDLLCGNQLTTMRGNGTLPQKYSVFPFELQDAVTSAANAGHSLLVSGSYIGTDVNESLYPQELNDYYSDKGTEFVSKVLGYTWITNHGSYLGSASPVKNSFVKHDLKVPFYNKMNSEHYWSPNPDGIKAYGKKAKSFLRYDGTDISAGVAYESDTYKSVSLGFPLECINDPDALSSLVSSIMGYLNSK